MDLEEVGLRGTVIKLIRKKHNKTVRELSRMIRVSEKDLSIFEKSEEYLPDYIVRALTETFAERDLIKASEVAEEKASLSSKSPCVSG